jgi:hypothetical protein
MSSATATCVLAARASALRVVAITKIVRLGDDTAAETSIRRHLYNARRRTDWSGRQCAFGHQGPPLATAQPAMRYPSCTHGSSSGSRMLDLARDRLARSRSSLILSTGRTRPLRTSRCEAQPSLPPRP